MISKLDKNADRKIRHARVRKKVSGTSLKPRFNVYRSTRYIYVQVIDDVNGVTLVAANSLQMADQLAGKTKQNKLKKLAHKLLNLLWKKVSLKLYSTEVVTSTQVVWQQLLKALAKPA